MRIAKQTTSVAHVGADRFAKMYCPAVPHKEQSGIAQRLSAFQAIIDSETCHLEKLRCQKLGVMHDLLTGRKRVSVPEVENEL